MSTIFPQHKQIKVENSAEVFGVDYPNGTMILNLDTGDMFQLIRNAFAHHSLDTVDMGPGDGKKEIGSVYSVLEITDTPESYVDQAGMTLLVNADEDGMIFGGAGYHKFTVVIPTPDRPISVGDVLAYYTGAWRHADSSREERTAQGAVVGIQDDHYIMIRFGDIIVPTHGYELNTWYWLKADGTFIKEKPAKLAQLLFYVYDADTLQFNIEQPITQIEEKLGWIHIGEQPNVGWTFTPSTINAFEELKIHTPHFNAANVRNFTLDPATHRIKVDFPVRPEEPVFVQISIMVALSLESGSTRNIEIAHGVDGRVDTTADWYNQLYGTNLPALGVFIPITYNWSGQVKNGHHISIFLRTEIREQTIGLAKAIQVTGQI